MWRRMPRGHSNGMSRREHERVSGHEIVRSYPVTTGSAMRRLGATRRARDFEVVTGVTLLPE